MDNTSLTAPNGAPGGYLVNSSSSQSKTSKCYQCLKNLNADQIQKCERCKIAIFCGKKCQELHWKTLHVQECTPKKQEATNVALQKMSPYENKIRLDFIEEYTKSNAAIRNSFIRYEADSLRVFDPTSGKMIDISTSDKKSHHPLLTQQFILEGCKHLDPQKSVVVVCGAQCYNGKFIEPLPELLSRCKKLILIDIDPVSLEYLSSLLNSPKVSTIPLDLTNSLKELESFAQEVMRNTYSKNDFIKQMKIFIEKLIADTRSRTAGLGVLGHEESADYVISSLVGSELSIKIRALLFDLFRKQFQVHFSSKQIPKLEWAEWVELFKTSTEVMIDKHLEDLLAWAGSSGTVYFADSTILEKQGVQIPIVPLSYVKKIKDHLKEKRENVKERYWVWIENSNIENSNSVYNYIKAFLCNNND